MVGGDGLRPLANGGEAEARRTDISGKIFSNSPQEELRSNIISMVKQSAALNRPSAENMKPRQLSDAIHQEIGDKVMSQISDGVWSVIRSPDGMKSEITETVQSVYDKLANPRGKDNGESSSHKDSPSIRNELEKNNDASRAIQTDGSPSDGEPNEPPGFGLADVNQRNKKSKKNQPNNIGMPTPHNGRAIEKNKGDNLHLEDLSDPDNMDCDAPPPGFSSVLKHKNSRDASDDPDVPPGFG
ncbi:hypothetical protein DH2020_036129 [Rehmannia glutinosa]|uniref:Uncharacterized protein n=1 Tax=Rehmannia glutinosa TaxID=99300 RepID=A0ABR0V6A3_REHGL